MKKVFHFSAFLLFIAALSFSSCVPKSKLAASQQRVYGLQDDSSATHRLLNACNISVTGLQGQKASLQDANASALNDLEDLSSKSKMTITDQSKRLKNLQNVIQSQKDVMGKLKNSIADALMNFKADELSVNIKDGKVYVSLAEKLLFKSGSDGVDPKGKEALKSLANVLNNTKDISVMIEGHTDDVPIKTKLFADNWDLSTARASSIVRILTEDYGFDSNRITASGRGSFHPLKTNKTTEGRAANRRTEIILSPDLKELYTLLDQ